MSRQLQTTTTTVLTCGMCNTKEERDGSISFGEPEMKRKIAPWSQVMIVNADMKRCRNILLCAPCTEPVDALITHYQDGD